MTDFRKRHDEARDAWSEWRARALEDLRFSNPAAPKQWDDEVLKARGRSRPALTFDQTNQYISQVVNDARQNKPSIDVVPGDSDASDEAAQFYGGTIRQIEYASRAQIAYDTAIEHAARIGLGFFLVVPELLDARSNLHDIRIKAVVDPLAVTIDPDSVEPDGQDADFGDVEVRMSEAAFKRRWPKANISSFKGDRWFDGSGVLVCQSFERIYEKTNRIITTDGQDFNEDDYHAATKQAGKKLDVHETYWDQSPKVKWCWYSGEEMLEEADYPASYIGIVPVYGNVLWIDGKRHVCGMTRRMMDACKAYNYERSAYIESVALSPKAPFVGPARAVARFQALWDNANQENRSYLPYDDRDADGTVIAEPKRQQPPPVGTAFFQNAQMALQDIQASVGMYKANLGQNSNAKSGVAINKLQTEGDTATFHYIDNLSRSIEQGGRICVEMIPVYYDQQRVQRILGIDGKSKAVQVNPQLQAAHDNSGDVLQVNPAIGAYDVRVKTGPSYTSMRQEMTDKLVQIGQGNPQLGAALAPLMLEMADFPGAERASRVAMALLPPPVQQAYGEEDGKPEIPPEVVQHVQQLEAHLQQAMQALQQAGARVQELEGEKTSDFNEQLIKAYDAETKRITALGGVMTPEAVMALVQQVVQQSLSTPSPAQIVPPDGGPPGNPMLQEQPPSGGFSLPGMNTPPAMAATGAQPGPGSMPVLPEGNSNVG